VHKSHYSLQNQIFLAMLKRRRCAHGLRQRDLGSMLGRNQAMVSKVESGERRLDVIELRTWLAAMEEDFVVFVADLDEQLREVGTMQGSVFSLGAASSSGSASNAKKRPRSK